MKKNIFKYLRITAMTIILAASLFSCGTKEVAEEESTVESKTPVTLTAVALEPIAENINLRATSAFQKKISVKATSTGYLENVNVNIGDAVAAGQIIFTIKTKEASIIENLAVAKDSSINFTGLISIRSQKSGIITTLDHQKGDYVQDGEQLGIISESNSLVFILEVPFELHSFLKINSSCEILLPDEQKIAGTVVAALPSMDVSAQTQSYVVKANTDMKLPENLVAKINIIKSIKQKAQVLPKQAILSDETQSEFWIMKMINDSTAVKVPVTKGIETTEKVEITAPVFNANDRIVLGGNYGLADTATVSITKGE